MKRIRELVKGEAPTLLHTSKGNEVIKAVNSLLALEVSPKGWGKIVGSGGKVVLKHRTCTVYFRVNGTIREFAFVGTMLR